MTTSAAAVEIGGSLGAYRIDRLLGRGETGVVYLAHHAESGRQVALKVVAPELVSSPRFRERFFGDCELAAGLAHPNALPVYDSGEVGGLVFVASRYVEGADLRGVLRDGALPTEQAIEIVEQVGAALHAAHSCGLVHRDVKPSNVRLEAGTHHIYVADFGLTGKTLDYASPERREGVRLDGRADVYSLGCVLVHCLTGHPTKNLAGLPPALQRIAAKALAKDPAERYTTAAELAEAVREVPIQPAPAPTLPFLPDAVATPPPPPARKRQRKRVVAVGLVVAVAAATALALVLRSSGGHHRAAIVPPAPPLRSLVAAQLRATLIPPQQALEDRIRGASASPASVSAIERAAVQVGDGIGQTDAWLATHRPKTDADRALWAALVRALAAHGTYAAFLADLGPVTSISKTQAAIAVANADRAERAYARLANLPAMPLTRADNLRLLAIAAPDAKPSPPALFDEVANSGGVGVRFRSSPSRWCGSAPQSDPCWRTVVPGLGAAEGQRLRIYCYAAGADVKGNGWWAEVSLQPTRYVPAAFLRSGAAYSSIAPPLSRRC